jgi:dihydroorotate dehydrogenase electron transfer subunit
MAKVVAEDRNRYDTIIGIGPKAMLREMCRVAKELGVVDRVWVSIETTVKCGMGICGSCCLRPLPKLLCRDGPLFRCIEVEEFLSRSS